MPMQAFVDESGSKGDGSWFTLVGLLSKSEDWAELADRWRAILELPPAVTAWHMRDAAQFRHEFKRWSPDVRDGRLRQLADVVNDYPITAFHCSVDLAAHAEFMAPLNDVRAPRKSKVARLGKTIREPYWMCFHAMVMAVCYELIDQGSTERFEMVFDESKTFGPRVKLWYPVFVDMMEPHEQAVMPIEPVFRDDKEFVPLQCADLLAWILHRDLVSGDGKPIFLSPRKVQDQDHTFDWIKNAMHGLVWSGHRQTFDRERLKGIREKAIRDPTNGEAAARMDRLLM